MARIYTQPTTASTGALTVALSVPTFVDEAPTMLNQAPSNDYNAMLESTVLPALSNDPVMTVPAYDLADAAPESTTPATLPMALATAVSNGSTSKKKRKKNRNTQDGQDSATVNSAAQTKPPVQTEEAPTAGTPPVSVESSLPIDDTTPLSPVDDPNNPDWKDYWPSNELVMYATMDPSTAQAPTLDGIRMIRTQAQITEIDPETSEVGIVAKVPVQILPMARGYEPLFNEITRARRRSERVRPFIVELRGVCKRLADQDTRFATARRTTLFGMQISQVKRIDKDHMQFGRWRGRGTVAAVRPFDLNGTEYFRVTLEVASTKRKVFLRGETAQVDLVDVLIRRDHKHANRFSRVGQRLLVEAEITSQTSVLRDDHPSLEGLDDDTRVKLGTLRQGIVLVNMGEFADARAETDFNNWLRTGQGNHGRPGRGRHQDGTGTRMTRRSAASTGNGYYTREKNQSGQTKQAQHQVSKQAEVTA